MIWFEVHNVEPKGRQGPTTYRVVRVRKDPDKSDLIVAGVTNESMAHQICASLNVVVFADDKSMDIVASALAKVYKEDF